jgi:aspartate aminotransferase
MMSLLRLLHIFLNISALWKGLAGKLVVVPANTSNFQINFSEFEKRINKNTKAVIVNSPNNPSGAVYSEETIIKVNRHA